MQNVTPKSNNNKIEQWRAFYTMLDSVEIPKPSNSSKSNNNAESRQMIALMQSFQELSRTVKSTSMTDDQIAKFTEDMLRIMKNGKPEDVGKLNEKHAIIVRKNNNNGRCPNTTSPRFIYIRILLQQLIWFAFMFTTSRAVLGWWDRSDQAWGQTLEGWVEPLRMHVYRHGEAMSEMEKGAYVKAIQFILFAGSLGRYGYWQQENGRYDVMNSLAQRRSMDEVAAEWLGYMASLLPSTATVTGGVAVVQGYLGQYLTTVSLDRTVKKFLVDTSIQVFAPMAMTYLKTGGKKLCLTPVNLIKDSIQRIRKRKRNNDTGQSNGRIINVTEQSNDNLPSKKRKKNMS